MYQIGHEQIQAHLNFKEFLLEHPYEAKKYGEWKVILASQFPSEHHKYQEGKQQFINALADKAKAWAAIEKSHFF